MVAHPPHEPRTMHSILSTLIGAPSARLTPQTRPHNCVQTVLAMALGTEIEEMERLAGTTGALTLADALNLLAGQGVRTRPVSTRLVRDFWGAFYSRNGGPRLCAMAVRTAREGEETGHAFLVLGRRIWDPSTGRWRSLGQDVLRELDWIVVIPEEARTHSVCAA